MNDAAAFRYVMVFVISGCLSASAPTRLGRYENKVLRHARLFATFEADERLQRAVSGTEVRAELRRRGTPHTVRWEREEATA